MAYCITKDTPVWNYSLSLAFVFHLYRLCNISVLHFQLLIVYSMQSIHLKLLCSSAEKYTIHRSTSTNHILHSQTSSILRMPTPPAHVENYTSVIYFEIGSSKMHSSHLKNPPVNQIKTKCFKELHKENEATSEWHVAFPNIHCSENVLPPSLCIQSI